MSVGEGRRVVEYVLLEQDLKPRLAGRLPYYAAIVAGCQEGEDQDDEKGAGGGEQDDEESGRR